MKIKLSNIIAIVNEGFSDKVMEIATANGARGGTIIGGNSSVSGNAHKLYGVDIQPEKELVMIVVLDSLANVILSELYDKLGTNSDARGIFFVLPIGNATENLTNQYSPKED